ncbi:MAG: hypothetical protein Greene071436_284 [Parcubacteria group bacterium Greene0714_36]|nr:MAG: hypothetical protein Greene071436_284 [Parcubacteria group bacterium Greene0714_36]
MVALCSFSFPCIDSKEILMATAMQRITAKLVLLIFGGILYATGGAGLLISNPFASVAPWLAVQTVGAIAIFKIIATRF